MKEYSDFIQNCIRKAYKINKKFFGFDIKYKLKLVYSRKEFDKIWEEKTKKWACACVNKGRIVIFTPSIFEKLTSHKFEEYQNVITHEMNHLFFQKLIGKDKLILLCEGIAMNVDGFRYDTKYKYQGKINFEFLSYGDEFKKLFKNAKEYYRNSYLIGKKLIRKLGKRKLVNLLKKYSRKPTKENYIKLFYKYIK